MAQIGLPPESFSHRAHSEVPKLLSPSADSLFNDHVLPSLPVVLQDCFDSVTFPPLESFPDFGYLRQRCSHHRVAVKAIAHSDRDGRAVFVGNPELRVPLCGILESIEASETNGSWMPFYMGKVPLRSELPELAEDIDGSPSSPQH